MASWSMRAGCRLGPRWRGGSPARAPAAAVVAPAASVERESMSDRKTVLILCTGNSCRSQIAQALVNHDLGPAVRAISAGTRPQPKVADGALEALRLAGIATNGLHPKALEAVLEEQIDLVVT